MNWPGLGRTLALLPLLLSLAPPAAAVAVDVELVLAVDVSKSIDDQEFELQRRGYADAFRDRRVVNVIRGGAEQRIAVTFVEWSGADAQAVIVGWTLINDAASAAAFADKVLAAKRPSAAGWTSISAAVDFSVPLFDDNGFEGQRRLIDISGDGINNQGRPVTEARDAAVARGVVINGLAILNDRTDGLPGGFSPAESWVDDFYLTYVIGGPGAFLLTTNDFTDFPRAVITKLVREIAGVDGATVITARD
jgi:Protein of unknown function (DUF1194)